MDQKTVNDLYKEFMIERVVLNYKFEPFEEGGSFGFITTATFEQILSSLSRFLDLSEEQNAFISCVTGIPQTKDSAFSIVSIWFSKSDIIFNVKSRTFIKNIDKSLIKLSKKLCQRYNLKNVSCKEVK